MNFRVDSEGDARIRLLAEEVRELLASGRPPKPIVFEWAGRRRLAIGFAGSREELDVVLSLTDAELRSLLDEGGTIVLSDPTGPARLKIEVDRFSR